MVPPLGHEALYKHLIRSMWLIGSHLRQAIHLQHPLVDQHSSEESVKEFTEQHSAAVNKPVKVHQCSIRTTEDGKVSARLMIDATDREIATAPNFWPRPLYVRVWRHRERPKGDNLSGAHSDALSESSDTQAQSFRILLTNTFGLLSKLGDFHHAVHIHQPDIAIVTESKLTPEKATDSELSLPGYYSPLRKDRTAHGGGVAVWVKASLALRELDDIQVGNEELT